MKNEFSRKVLSSFPPEISLLLFKVKFYSLYHKKIDYLLKKINDDYCKSDLFLNLNTDQQKKLKREMKNYCYYCSHIGAEEFLDSYFSGEELTCLRRAGVDASELRDTEPILVCCVKNDLKRIVHSIDYHKSIGIKKMVYVDNMSDDGTREWLLEQDVDLYSIGEKYHAGRKSAWIRKVMDIYGYNRWYLVVDSDELFTFVGCEEHDIAELVNYCKINSMDRVASFLLDMYPDHQLYQSSGENNYILDNRFFDSDSYYMSKDGRGYMLRGGPRKRVFESNLDYSEPLSKYPLIYATEEDLWSDHRPLPFYKNFRSRCFSVLRHYKFMEGDYEKYKKIAADGNYYNGSENYKIYSGIGVNITFMYGNSKEYRNSESLTCLEYIEKIW